MIKLFLFFFLFVNILTAEKIQKSEWQRPNKIPSPKNNPLSKEKILLGKKLFFDPILSRGNNISCATCHNPLKGWSDGDTIAIGDKGRSGVRNTPSILNSAYQYIYFWDGRAKSLEEQALGPIAAHVEMNLDPTEAVEKLRSNAEYKKIFQELFPKEGITTVTLAKAIASFERSIVSGKSRFDLYMAGDKTKLSHQEMEGFSIFINKANCVVCHSGFNFSDQSFNNVGIANGDIGRAKIKNRALWRGAFKTPTLRDLANTSPYFHDGSAQTLEEAVEFCAKGHRDKNTTVSPILIDKKLSQKDIDNIVAFLHALSEPVIDFK